jgi:hypothetical protein
MRITMRSGPRTQRLPGRKRCKAKFFYQGKLTRCLNLAARSFCSIHQQGEKTK